MLLHDRTNHAVSDVNGYYWSSCKHADIYRRDGVGGGYGDGIGGGTGFTMSLIYNRGITLLCVYDD